MCIFGKHAFVERKLKVPYEEGPPSSYAYSLQECTNCGKRRSELVYRSRELTMSEEWVLNKKLPD